MREKRQHAAESATPTRDKVPVVIITGFLGAGKTTLMEHILSNAGGKVVGCVVNDFAALNIDGKLINDAAESTSAGSSRHVVTLEDGCICCERSGDLLPCIDELLRRKALSADPRPFDAILIECTGLAEPSQMKRSFASPQPSSAFVLNRVSLVSVVAVVDASTFQDQYESRARSRADKRCIVDLLMDQVEVSDLVIANKMDRVDEDRARLLEELLATLNPGAVVRRAQYSRVSLESLLRPHERSLSETSAHPSAKRSRPEPVAVDILEKLTRRSAPLSLRAAVNSFVYAGARPFHPVRLASLVHQLPTQRVAGTSLTQGAAGSDHALANLLRSKGFVWVASQPDTCFKWSYAGCHFQLTEHGPWRISAQVAASTGTGASAGAAGDGIVTGGLDLTALGDTPAKDAHAGPCQQIIFIGLGLDSGAIGALLDACLLQDWEMAYFDKGLVPPEADPNASASPSGGSDPAPSPRGKRRGDTVPPSEADTAPASAAAVGGVAGGAAVAAS